MKISHISHMMLYVRDQDEAKRFYTETLGFELGDDVPLGPDFRWLTVHLPGQESPLVCLMPPRRQGPRASGAASGSCWPSAA